MNIVTFGVPYDRTTLQGYHTVLLNSTVELPSEFTCKPQCEIAVCRVQTRRDYVAGAVAAVCGLSG